MTAENANALAFLRDFLADELAVRRKSFEPPDPDEAQLIADAERAAEAVEILARALEPKP